MKTYILILVGLFIASIVVLAFADEVIWDNISAENLDLSTVLLNPESKRIIYFGSSKGVFKTEDGASSWRNVLSIKGGNRQINLLLFDPLDKKSIYAATGNGLFFSNNSGKDWKKIFKGKNSLENECTVLAVSPFGIYLGTKAGFFTSSDKGRSWHKANGKVGNTNILAIAYNPNDTDCVYIASTDGVFKSQDNCQSWERIFVANPTENGLEAEEISEDSDEVQRFSAIRYIACDLSNLDYIYLATLHGVYKSTDKGKSWEMLSNYGLLSGDIKSLLITNTSNIYAATKSAVFEYKDRRWHELSLRLTAEDIRFLASDSEGSLYVACEAGLFKANKTNPNSDKQGVMIEDYCKDEPKIKEIQQAAIKYAEVEPDKISKWRKQAAKKAFLPSVSAGVSRDNGDLWHWESGSTTKSGDDVLVKGRDTLDWDIRLTWNLGEIIWNDDQTSIDVRSRLMVQLRDDILDEVTKLYFERIRVKMEIDTLSIEDRKKRADRMLRLQELTASLDALTGGYFSQQLDK